MSDHYERMQAIIAKVNSIATHHVGVSDAINYAQWLADSLETEREEHATTQSLADEWAKQLLEAQDEITAALAKLEKAMAVVDVAIGLAQKERCPFCAGRPEVLSLAGRITTARSSTAHHDCPLVNGGFIDKDGKRL